MKLIVLISLCFFLAAACGPQPETDRPGVPEETVLVLVDGRPITLPMLEFMMTARGVGEDDAEGMRRLLDELIRIRVVANAAEDHGLAEDERIRAERAVRDMETLYVRFLERHQAEHPVEEADIERAYREQVERAGDTQYRIETVSWPAQAPALLALAAVQDGETGFDDMVETARAEERAVERPGWIDRSQVPQEFGTELARTSPGEAVPALLATGDDWRLVRVLDTRPLEAPPLEDVRTGILRTLRRDRAQALIEEYYDAAEIVPMLPIEDPAG